MSCLSAPLPCQVVHPTFTRLPCYPQDTFALCNLEPNAMLWHYFLPCYLSSLQITVFPALRRSWYLHNMPWHTDFSKPLFSCLFYRFICAPHFLQTRHPRTNNKQMYQKERQLMTNLGIWGETRVVLLLQLMFFSPTPFFTLFTTLN